jgi:hypothetical protein
MAQDWRITIAIAKYKHKVRQEAPKHVKTSNLGKSDYEKWLSKELTKNKQK